MYIPKTKQKVGGALNGSLIDPKTGLQFTGKFVTDFLNRVYKGDKIDSKSDPLEFIPHSEVTERIKYSNDFITEFVTPTQREYEIGSFTRYFVKDGRSGRVIEVNKEKYNFQKVENKLYRRVLKVEWYISGNIEDQLINGYLYPGTRRRNQDVIDQSEKILPGIAQQVLKDPEEFVK